jgi:hypothetical protein
LYFNNGKLLTSLPNVIDKKKVQVIKNRSTIFIHLRYQSTTPVIIQLTSLEGKILFTEKYQTPNQIELDFVKYGKQVVILNVIDRNQTYTEKVILN